jgi:hypothetical protein
MLHCILNSDPRSRFGGLFHLAMCAYPVQLVTCRSKKDTQSALCAGMTVLHRMCGSLPLHGCTWVLLIALSMHMFGCGDEQHALQQLAAQN